MFSVLLDLIFPPACVSCGEIGGYICERCYRTMHFYDHPILVQIPRSSLDTLYACTPYTHIAQELIKTYKFGCAYALSQPISKLMQIHLQKPKSIDIITSVPLHKKRYHDRGFNQAELIAKHLSATWNIPYVSTLIRTENTTPQAQLTRKDRLHHLKKAFSLNQHNVSYIQGTSVLLIDDVSTTGTTLNECAKVLKQNQAELVTGMVFAHG